MEKAPALHEHNATNVVQSIMDIYAKEGSVCQGKMKGEKRERGRET